jgi:hypothetical protein
MNELELFLRFSFLGLSSLVSIISLLSLIKIKEMKVGFACVGFLLFTLEGILVSIGVFSSAIEAMVTPATLLGVSFLALIFFYLSILKR